MGFQKNTKYSTWKDNKTFSYTNIKKYVGDISKNMLCYYV